MGLLNSGCLVDVVDDAIILGMTSDIPGHVRLLEESATRWAFEFDNIAFRVCDIEGRALSLRAVA